MNFYKNSIITIFTRVFVYIAALFISIYIARIFGPVDKGIYALLTQFVIISVLFIDFGIQNAAVYYLGNREPIKQIFPSILTLSLLRGLIVSAVLFLSLGCLRNNMLKNISVSLIILAFISIPFKIFTEASSAMLLGLNKIKLFNALRVIQFSVLAATFIILVILFKTNLTGAIISFGLTEIIMTFVFLFVFSNWVKVSFRLDLALIKKVLSYGMRAFLVPLFIIIIFRSDFYLLNYFKDSWDVGIYSVSVSFVELLYFLPEIIGVVLFPKLASDTTGLVNINTVRVLRTILAFLFIGAIFLFIFAPALVLLVYGNQFQDSILSLRILLPGFFMMSLYYIFSSYFFSKNKPEVLTVVLLATMILKIVLAVILIPLWGYTGAAIGSTVTYIFCGFALLFVFLRFSKERLFNAIFIKASDINYLSKHFNSALQNFLGIFNNKFNQG